MESMPKVYRLLLLVLIVLTIAGRFLIVPRLTHIPTLEGSYEAFAHMVVGFLILVPFYDPRERVGPSKLYGWCGWLLGIFELVMFVAQRFGILLLLVALSAGVASAQTVDSYHLQIYALSDPGGSASPVQVLVLPASAVVCGQVNRGADPTQIVPRFLAFDDPGAAGLVCIADVSLALLNLPNGATYHATLTALAGALESPKSNLTPAFNGGNRAPCGPTLTGLGGVKQATHGTATSRVTTCVDVHTWTGVNP
jgi:hypothetical protein